MLLLKTFHFLYKKNIFFFLLLFIVSLILFYKTFFFQFIVDDYPLIWETLYHPELYGIYWGHPLSVLEFFVFVKLFGVHTFAFTIFGIFLRTLSAFVGYLFVAKLTKSKAVGVVFSFLFVSSYIGYQSTTWASAHIVALDVILIAFTCYRYLLYLSSKLRKDFIVFLIFFTITILSDPGRNFPLAIYICCLWLYDRKNFQIHRLLKVKEIGRQLLILLITIAVFLLWFVVFGYFFKNSATKVHHRIPFETIVFFFGSLANCFFTPFLRTFEFSLATPTGYLPYYIASCVALPSLWIYATFLWIKKKSFAARIISLLLVWMFVFYFPHWISYPRSFVPSIHRYLTISGLGFVGILSFIIVFLSKKHLLVSRMLFFGVLVINVFTTSYYLHQENIFRSQVVISKVWNVINKDIPKGEKGSLLFFQGSNPLVDWGMVFSGAYALRLMRNDSNTKPLIETNVLEKIANELCHDSSYSLVNFHAWKIDKNGRVENLTNEEKIILNKTLKEKDACRNLRIRYGDHFTYFN